MDLMSKLTISASMLLTGFAIVFGVLLFLILVIWGYGRIISSAQTKASNRTKKRAKIEKIAVKTVEKSGNMAAPVKTKPVITPKTSDEISDELVAVISAAVYSIYGSKDKVKIKSIKKSSGRSAWANAGVLHNTRPF